MLKEDRPIKHEKDDLLARNVFIDKFSRALLEYDSKEPLVIGVNGAWGSGKTSLVNLIVNKIEDVYKEQCKDVSILTFEPWHYSNVTQLIEQYFALLAGSFANKKDDAFKTLGDLLERYGQGLSGVLSNTVLGGIAELIPKIGEEIKGTTIYGSRNLTSQRKEIINKLEAYPGRLIVVIDDIDRLPFDQIREIFRLVASVANFPNTIFILSFDRGIVSKALDKEQDNGAKYIEKIVQVPIEIPPVSKAQINAIFDNVFGEYLEKNGSMVWQKEHWYRVVDYILNMISNIRDIIRLSNTLSLKMSMVGEEVNFADMVLLTSIEIKYHSFYKWIYENKEILTGSEVYSLRSFGRKPEEEKRILIESIEKENLCIETELALEMLSELFPKVASNVRAGMGLLEDADSLVRNQRIASPGKFDRYFSLSIEEGQINRMMFNEAIKNMDIEGFIAYANDIVEHGQSYGLVTELRAILPDLKFNEAVKVVKALIETFDSTDYAGTGNTILSPKFRFEYLIYDLFMIIHDEDQQAVSEIIHEAINKASIDKLEIIAEILRQEALAYNVIPTNESGSSKRFVTEEQFRGLATRYVEKAMEIDKDHNLLSIESANYSLGIIRWVDPETYKQYIENKFADDVNVLRYVIHNMGAGTYTDMRGTGVTYSLSEELRSEEFIKHNYVEEIIKNSLMDGTIMNFKPKDVVKLAAFMLRDDDRLEIGVTEQKCLEQIEKWETGEIN